MRKLLLTTMTAIIFASCSSTGDKKTDARVDKFVDLTTELVTKEYISNDSSTKLLMRFTELDTAQMDSMIFSLGNVLKSPPPPPTPKMTEEEYVKYYQTKWDSVKLYAEDGFYQYDSYLNELSAINQEMAQVVGKYFPTDSIKCKVNKLRLKLVDSKKMREGTKNYFTYGQPETKYDLKSVCESYLEKNLKDPDSYELDEYRLDGQTKNGYAVTMRYRAKNSFGALTLEQAQFDVRFDPTQKMYYVQKVYSQ